MEDSQTIRNVAIQEYIKMYQDFQANKYRKIKAFEAKIAKAQVQIDLLEVKKLQPLDDTKCHIFRKDEEMCCNCYQYVRNTFEKETCGLDGKQITLLKEDDGLGEESSSDEE